MHQINSAAINPRPINPKVLVPIFVAACFIIPITAVLERALFPKAPIIATPAAMPVASKKQSTT